MNVDILKKILWLLVLALAQVLVLNHIQLFGCATPLLYVYFVMLFRRNYPRWSVLVWSFVLGLIIDVFSNTPGVTCGSLTFLALVQPYLLMPFIPRDSAEDLEPGMRTLGVAQFSYYSFFLVFIYCLVFFTLEMFNFFNWLLWVECVAGSSLLTFILILVIENVRRSA